MKEFLAGQIDLFYFICGVLFFLVSAVSIFYTQIYKVDIPWRLFGLFTVSMGLKEVLDLASYNLKDVDFGYAGIVLLCISFVALMEFNRLTDRRLNNQRIGVWIYAPLLGGMAWGMFKGAAGAYAAISYLLGCVACPWAARTFLSISRKENGKWRFLTITAWALLAWGGTMLFMVPQSDVFPRPWLTPDTFLKWTGMPVEFIHSLLVGAIAFSIWFYFESYGESGEVKVQQIIRWKKSAPLAMLLLSLVFGGGCLYVQWATQAKTREQQSKIFLLAQRVAFMLNAGLIEGLTGTAQDAGTPSYEKLKEQLQMLQSHASDMRFIYLMRKVEDHVVFLVDSEPAGSPNESPPGQLYSEASAGVYKAFATGEENVEGPYRDRWGSWISAHIPIKNRLAERVIAVLAIDQNSRQFLRAVCFERLKAIGIVGLVCFVALFLFAYFRRFTEALYQLMDVRDLFFRWGILSAVVVGGVVLTFLVFWVARHDSQEALYEYFQKKASARLEMLSQAVLLELDRLDGIRRFFENSNEVSRGEFQGFAGPLLDSVSFQALEWIPLVHRQEVADYEEKARQEGLADFRIVEKDAQQQMVPVQERPEYFPVYYLQPLKGNERALGFDLASEPIRQWAMEKCRNTDMAVATEPVRLIQASGDKTGFLVFMGVFNRHQRLDTLEKRRENLRGFVLGVFKGGEFLSSYYTKGLDKGLACRIEDLKAPAEKRLLFEYIPPQGQVEWNNKHMHYNEALLVADRKWNLTIAPTDAFAKENASYGYFWILPMGFLLTGFLAFFLNTLAMGRYQLEVLVRQRTAELNKEKELSRKQEENYRLLLDSTAEAIYGVDLTGKCTFCNPSCVRVLGYADANDLLGKHMHELIHHTYPDGTSFPVEKCSIYMSFKKQVRVHEEQLLWRRDGTSFAAEIWSHPEYRDGKVVGAVVSFLDITERKKAEAAIRNSEERFRQIASAITDYIYTVHLEDGKPVRTIYNQACLAVTGYSADEFRSDPMLWFKTVVEEDRPLVLRQVEDILANKDEILAIEHRIVHKNGNTCWIKSTIVPHRDAQGRLISYDGLISDITARREAEKVLEDQKRALDEHAIVSKTDPRGIITYVNDKFCVISKYSREELIGKTHRLLNSGFHPKEFFEEMWQALKDGKAWHGKIRNRAKDGSHHWLQSTMIPIFDNQGGIKEYIAARTDITQSIENEERLERAMQVQTNFVSTVSHELRTPLAAIKSSVDIIDTEIPGKLTEQQRTFIKRVKSNIDRLARLINDVLDLSKLESGKMVMNFVPLKVDEIIRDVVDIQLPVAKGKGLTIETEFGGHLPLLVADRDRLIQVLNNLIGNAIKFTKEGKVVVAVRVTDAKQMHFEVRDTGPGIKDDDLRKLFQKFQQLGDSSQQVGGTGLGLAICKEIVLRHQGRIWVEARPGVGASFHFTIPLRKEKRILVVDDDETTRDILRNVLEAQDAYEVGLASDGFSAGQMLIDFVPHLIILDINLPKINGIDICQRIRRDAHRQRPKIIMLSTFDSEAKKKAAWDAGTDEILGKPINTEELFAKVRKLLS